MYEIHTDSKGNTMLIAQMDDRHLINTINQKLRLFAEAKAALGINISTTDPLISILAPQLSTERLQRQAKQRIQDIHESIQPYILEASLRGLGITVQLQKAYGRTIKLPDLGVQNLLPESESESDDDYDSDSDYSPDDY